MSWVAAGTAAVGIAGNAAGSAGSGSPVAQPISGDFTGGSIGDWNYNPPKLTPVTIWVIVGAIATVLIVWLLRKKK